jgi:hypothetical protein
MERPVVNVVQYQQEEIKQVDGYEAAALLAKYGYSPANISYNPTQTEITSNSTLTFEEMIAEQGRKQAEERMRQYIEQQRRLNAPRAISFDQNNVGYSETKYSSIDTGNGDSIGIQIQIVTDMKF